MITLGFSAALARVRVWADQFVALAFTPFIVGLHQTAVVKPVLQRQ